MCPRDMKWLMQNIIIKEVSARNPSLLSTVRQKVQRLELRRLGGAGQSYKIVSADLGARGQSKDVG